MYPKCKITLEKYLVNHTKTCYGLLNIVSRDFFVMLVGWHLLFKFLLGNQTQYILANLCFDLVCSTQIRRDNSCSGWTMKSWCWWIFLLTDADRCDFGKRLTDIRSVAGTSTLKAFTEMPTRGKKMRLIFWGKCLAVLLLDRTKTGRQSVPKPIFGRHLISM